MIDYFEDLWKAAPLKLKQFHRKRWTKRNDSYLRRNYHKLTAQALADKLNRSRQSVWIRCWRLGLHKYDKPEYYNKERDDKDGKNEESD